MTDFSKKVTMDGVRGAGENFPLALLAGAVAAVAGAVIWMGVTELTGLHVGYVAIGIGFMVGMAIRYAGNGTHIVFGIMGAIFTLVSCLSGEVLAVIQGGTTAQMGFMDVLKNVDLVELVTRIVTEASPVTYFIYAIGVFEGFKLSVRK